MSIFLPPCNTRLSRALGNAHARGFTLIEILMAILVLALALTGAMRLHLIALQALQQSNYQNDATLLAADMAEMIRAWHAPTDAGDAPFLFDYRSGDPLAAAEDCTGGTLCDPAALRRFGIASWLHAVEDVLPMARVRICRDAAASGGGDGGVGQNAGAAWACNGSRGAGIVIKIGWRPFDIEASASSVPAAPQFALDIGDATA